MLEVPDFAAIGDPTAFWFLAILCAACVGFSKSGIAGAGILAVPLMAHIFPAGRSTGILLPMLIAGDFFAVWYYRKHAIWPHVIRALPWATMGILTGWRMMKYLSEREPGGMGIDRVLRPSIGILVLVVLLLGAWVQRRREAGTVAFPTSWWFAALVGIVGGVATMTANAAGPVFLIYLLALQLPKEGFLGTSGWLYLILNTCKLPFSYDLGFISPASLVFDLQMVPAIASGALIGILSVKRMSERSFSRIVKVLAGAAALKLIF